MKTAIDARWIFPEISGIGTYTRELIAGIAKIDSQNEYTLLFQNPSVMERTKHETGTSGKANFKHMLVPHGIFSIRNQLAMPTLLKRMQIDIFHSTNYMIPLAAFPRDRAGRIKCVATIHDVIPMIFPDHAPKSKKTRLYPLYRRLMMEIGLRSNAIITVSNASASDITKHLNMENCPEKVHAIYNGVSPSFRPAENNVKSTNADGGKTILYVGRSDPYKNVTALIRAFAGVRQKRPFPVSLTIAGPEDQRYPEPQKLAEQLGVRNHIRWTGYLKEDQLVSLYQNSSVLVHPSRYEGFGLQIIEAMACGLPVICTNSGSLPEVAGDAAIVLSPDDINGMTDSIISVLSDSRKSAEMRALGLQQAKKFSWARTAAQTLEIYSELNR